MMLFEDDYEDDDDDDKNMTRCFFGLILFAYTAKSPGNIVFPLKLVFSPIMWRHDMRKKIYCAVCMKLISQKAEKW